MLAIIEHPCSGASRAGAEVRVEEKLDGALIIRSVIGGEVVFRTRGTFDGGERGREARRIAARRYPQLLDPELMAGSSLLFEHLSSDERFAMVLDYGRDDLVFLDAVEHETLRLADPREKERIAGSLGLNPARSEPLPASLTELERAVRRRRGQEGAVVRFDSGQTLLKVKSSDYMRLHRMRYRLSDSEIVEFCRREGIRSAEQFEDRLRKSGADWELISSASPVAAAVCEAEKHAESRFDELESMVDELFLRHAGKTERIKAEINELPEGERDAALLIFDGREGPAAERLRDAFIAAALARRSPAES